MIHLCTLYALLSLFEVFEVALGFKDNVITITTYKTTTICIASATAWASSSDRRTTTIYDSTAIHSSSTEVHGLGSTWLTTWTLPSNKSTASSSQSILPARSTSSTNRSTLFVIVTVTETRGTPLTGLLSSAQATTSIEKPATAAQNQAATRLWGNGFYTIPNGTSYSPKGTAASVAEQTTIPTRTNPKPDASIAESPPIGAANQAQPHAVWLLTLLALIAMSR